MKKHTIGLIVFGLIISSTVLIKSFFPVGTENFDVAKTRNSCLLMKRERIELNASQTSKSDKSIIEQATLDLNTRKMNWRIKSSQTNSLVALHFFVANENGTNYVATELAPSASLDKSSYGTGDLEFTSSYLWLDKLNTPQNLYVIPEKISLSDYRAKKFDVTFNEKTATSVLIYASGKVK